MAPSIGHIQGVGQFLVQERCSGKSIPSSLAPLVQRRSNATTCDVNGDRCLLNLGAVPSYFNSMVSQKRLWTVIQVVINDHRPCRWYSGTATPDNVIRCCPSKASSGRREFDSLAVLERIS